MKLRWKITFGLLATAIVCGVLLLPSARREQKTLEETRRALHQQGFKVDLSEFDFSAPDEYRTRAAALTNTVSSTVSRSHEESARRAMVQQVLPDLMPAVGLDATIAVWQRDNWAATLEAQTYLGLASSNLWSALRESFDYDQELLDAACSAILSGPIRFNLNASHGSSMLLPHLSTLKNLSQTLGCRTVLELHDGNAAAAWTNLLAATRLVTAYEPESSEMSHLVRFACAAIAFNITWQALQASGWTDEHLTLLQREWGSVDFFKKLPETAAFTRASFVAVCQLERQQPLASGMPLEEMIRSPRSAWSEIKWRWQEVQYRRYGSYEDEKDLLHYYRDREVELRRAVHCATWSEMRHLPGVTNMIPFQSKHASQMQTMLNMRQINLGFQRQGQGLLGRAAEAEVRRRLIITAIALERFRNRHGSYPRILEELTPEFLKATPIDFTDGEPLRYRLAEENHFVLYSVGLDCADDGGKMPQRGRPAFSNVGVSPFGISQQTDLVWPRPASEAEILAEEQLEKKARNEQMEKDRIRSAEEEKNKELSRQARVEELLSRKAAPRMKEPTFNGKPLAKLLRNTNSPASSQLTVGELLTLKQVVYGEDSGMAAFEVPIRYDIVTNIGDLHLLVDPEPGNEPTSDYGDVQEFKRATNGNCLLVWNTVYDPAGQHALQAQLRYTDNKKSWEELYVEGPVRPYFSSNLFQLDSFSVFGERGAYLHAKLAEPHGTYKIELKSPTGGLIRTFTGSTTNGEIEVFWDLIDERGNRYTNDSFESSFSVTLQDSGRSVTNK